MGTVGTQRHSTHVIEKTKAFTDALDKGGLVKEKSEESEKKKQKTELSQRRCKKLDY